MLSSSSSSLHDATGKPHSHSHTSLGGTNKEAKAKGGSNSVNVDKDHNPMAPPVSLPSSIPIDGRRFIRVNHNSQDEGSVDPLHKGNNKPLLPPYQLNKKHNLVSVVHNKRIASKPIVPFNESVVRPVVVVSGKTGEALVAHKSRRGVKSEDKSVNVVIPRSLQSNYEHMDRRSMPKKISQNRNLSSKGGSRIQEHQKEMGQMVSRDAPMYMRSSFFRRSPIPVSARTKDVRPVPGSSKTRSLPIEKTKNLTNEEPPLLRTKSYIDKSTVGLVESAQDIVSKEISNAQIVPKDLSQCTLIELKSLAKSCGLKGYSKLRKGELVLLLKQG